MAANIKKSLDKKEKGAADAGPKKGLDLKWILAAVGIGAIAMGGAIIGIQLAPAKVVTQIETKTEFVEKLPAKPGPSVPMMSGQVVNLKGGRYLRFSCVLQFAANEQLWPTGGGGNGGHGAKAVNPLENYEAMMKDVIVTTASRHTASELLTLTGKERLKTEIKVALNHEMGVPGYEDAVPAAPAAAPAAKPASHGSHGHGGGGGHDEESKGPPEVIRVFFTDFVIQ